MFTLVNLLLMASVLMFALLVAASSSMSSNLTADIVLDDEHLSRAFGQSGWQGGDEATANPTALSPHVAAAGMQ